MNRRGAAWWFLLLALVAIIAIGFYLGAIPTIVVALLVYMMEWRDRHDRAATPPPTWTH